jgi:beta-lactamase regulating signal transducer with metallopeptidase domain
MIEQLNSIAQSWWSWMWPMFWQVSVLIILIGAVDLLLQKRIWPQVRYAIWLLVLIKLILPPSLSLPTSIVSLARMKTEHITTKIMASKSPDKPTSVELRSGMNAHLKDTFIKPFPESQIVMSNVTNSPREMAALPILRGEPPVREDAGDIAGTNINIKIHWHVYVMAVWLAVVLALSSWVIVRFRRLRKFHAGAVSCDDLPQWFEALLAETVKKLGLRKSPEIALSRNISSPAVFGVFRPVLLLPVDAIHHLSPRRTGHILLHELTHIKRGDLLINTLYMLMQIIYWFNPLLWLLRSKLQHLRELCCDGTVARMLRDETADYRDTIVEVTQRFLTKPVGARIGLLGMTESSSRLLVRLKWLEKKTWKYRGVRYAIISIIVGLMSACVLPMAKAGSATVSGKSEATPVNTSDVALLYHREPDVRIKAIKTLAASNNLGIIDDLIRAHSVEIYTPVHNEYDRLLQSLTGIRNVRGKGAWKAWLASEVEAGRLKIEYLSVEPAANVRGEILAFALMGPDNFNEMAAALTAATYDQQRCQDAIRYMVFNDNLAQVQEFLAGDWLTRLFANQKININDVGYFVNGLANPGPLRKQIDTHVQDCLDSENPIVVANALNLIAGVEGYATRFVVPGVEDKVVELTSSSVPEIAIQAKRALARVKPRKMTVPRSAITEVKDGLHIMALIDGKDTIKINNNELWYEHYNYNLPGQWWNRADNIKYDEPTYINGTAWKPEWQARISKPYRLKQSIPLKENKNQIRLTKIAGRGSVSFTEMPQEVNNYTLSILLDDNRYDEAQWYEFVIQWGMGDSQRSQERGTSLQSAGNSAGLQTDESVSGVKNRLQRIVDSTQPGGKVIIPKGVYTGPITITKPLTLEGESRNDCIFEVTANEPAILFDTKGKGKVIIEAVTVKWQLATSDKCESPFAIAVKDSNVEVRNCCLKPLGDFKRSPVAIYSRGFSELNINTCRFEGFEYTVCFGEGTKGSVRNSLIMDSGHQGISLYTGSTAEIAGNVVTGSKYHAVRSTGGTLNMTDNLIINNANRGVYLGNRSAGGTISNNVIIGNGTGISGYARTNVKVENNVIADSSYAGIGLRDSCSLTIRDNIFQGNERAWILFKETGGSGNTVQRNTFWQNKIETENLDKATDSITADPGFVDAGNGDFSLKPGSALQQSVRTPQEKQGLTNPGIFKMLWKMWQNRADENQPFTEISTNPKPEKTDM